MENLSIRLVFDRRKIATKTHPAAVYIEATYRKKRKFINTGVKLLDGQWGNNCKVRNHPQSNILNESIERQVASIYDFAHSLQMKGEEFDFVKLENHLSYGKGSGKDTFLRFMKKRIWERPIGESTKERHWGMLKALEDFGKIKSFDDLTQMNILAWDAYAKKRCSKLSSVYNYHKILKIYIREAYAAQMINHDPYVGVRIKRGTSDTRRYLTEDELYAIESKKIENASLRTVRDVFVFCCYTGLAYSDIAKFDFKKAVYNDGMYRIKDARKKTGTTYNISLIDKAMEILRRYDFSLPIISNQKYNSYLKVLGSYCDVKQHLTSHVARHNKNYIYLNMK